LKVCFVYKKKVHVSWTSKLIRIISQSSTNINKYTYVSSNKEFITLIVKVV